MGADGANPTPNPSPTRNPTYISRWVLMEWCQLGSAHDLMARRDAPFVEASSATPKPHPTPNPVANPNPNPNPIPSPNPHPDPNQAETAWIVTGVRRALAVRG